MDYVILTLLLILIIAVLRIPSRNQLDGAIINQYRQTLELLFNIQKNQSDMNAATKALLDGILGKVTAQGTVITSGIALLVNIKGLLDKAVQNAGPDADPDFVAEVQGISDGLGAQTVSLTNAITANTPTEGQEPPAVENDLTFTATTGEVIVVKHFATDNVPAVGDSATVNGQLLSGVGASFTFADGSSITLDDQSKVNTFTPAPEAEQEENQNESGSGVTL